MTPEGGRYVWPFRKSSMTSPCANLNKEQEGMNCFYLAANIRGSQEGTGAGKLGKLAS